MKFEIPAGAQKILRTLADAGYEAYLVGGCVRDLLRGVAPHDWDICTSARPEETEACFAGQRIIETGLKHGTVTVLVEGEPYEITTYRTEGPLFRQPPPGLCGVCFQPGGRPGPPGFYHERHRHGPGRKPAGPIRRSG